METGMLWYDDDARRSLAEKVARAAEHYRTKYGATPTVCFVHPGALKDAPETAAGVQLRAAHTVMLHHFWIGVGEANGRDGKGNGNGVRAARSNGGKAARPAARRRRANA